MTKLATIPDLAVVGAGYWGKNLARNFNTLGVLHMLCDRSPTTLATYGSEFESVIKCEEFSAVLDDPVITKVVIAAPAAQHYSLTKAALEAGKDVFVEKPLCLDLKDAECLANLAEREGRILMVGHLLQYHPCVAELQRLVQQGELGKLQYITSNRLNLGKIRREENALWSFAPHDISVILSLVGEQLPDYVRCMGESYLTSNVPDTTLTFMKFSGGVRAHVYVSWLNPFKEQKLTVVGSRGMAVFDDTKSWSEKLVLHRDYLTWSDGLTPTLCKTESTPIVLEEKEPLRVECQHFLQCCLDRTRPKTDSREGIRVLQILNAAQSSLDRDGELARTTVQASQPYFAHPSAVIAPNASIAAGCKIWHFSHVMAGAELGPNCVLGQNVMIGPEVKMGKGIKVQNNVSIYAGTTIEDDVFLGPSCVLTNVTNPRSQIVRQHLYEKTLLRRGATIGANATIVCGVTLGRYCFIGAGAVVTKNVPDYALVVGNPARKKGWMSRHGHPLVAGPSGVMICPESGYRYVEVAPEVLRCQDLDEDKQLPTELRRGTRRYDEFKQASD